jgi:L-ribulokinase
MEGPFVLGLDFGTDSCRALVVDALSGKEASSSSKIYPRWERGLYCDKGQSRFRQHPLDYIEALEAAVTGAVKNAGPEITALIKGIGIDTTGSTPCAVDAEGSPLALKQEFAENPGAMFVLWKDHTGIAESDRINEVNRSWEKDYLKYSGGLHSSEWFWAKVLRILREDEKIAGAAVSFMEHCDWMPALLSENRDLSKIRRSRCAMGLRALWHNGYGYPPRRFFEAVDPGLGPVYDTLGTECWSGDTIAGRLSGAWAARLGLPPGIPISTGGIDAHVGGVGGGVRPGLMVMVAGTSTCDILTGPVTGGEEKPVRGICGQVEGGVVPGMIGYEAGQSAFGDIYAWFRDLLLWPLKRLLPGAAGLEGALLSYMERKTIPALEAAAERIEPGAGGVTALDWFNGRRTPDVNHLVKGLITGLGLGSDAPRVYRALVEAAAFGVRAIVERFRREGLPIDRINAVGGVARKSPLVMQITADILNMPIHVLYGDQTVALGAAMFAATAAGIYPDIPSAQRALTPPVEKIYTPRSGAAALYETLRRNYAALGAFAEQLASN